MKNKNILIIVGVVLVLLVAVGGFFVLNNRSNNAEDIEETQSLDEDAIKIDPEEIGLEMVASSNKKQVKFIINKPEGIEQLEYELSYEADSAGGSSEDGDGGSGKINRGVAGEDVIDPDESVYESKFLDLGSCSSGTCKYDTGVETVNLLLKITKTDGKIYQVETRLDL